MSKIINFRRCTVSKAWSDFRPDNSFIKWNVKLINILLKLEASFFSSKSIFPTLNMYILCVLLLYHLCNCKLFFFCQMKKLSRISKVSFNFNIDPSRRRAVKSICKYSSVFMCRCGAALGLKRSCYTAKTCKISNI